MNESRLITVRQAEGLCEIVHDISVGLYCRLNNMDEDDRDRLMDSLDGSRGLFWQHVLLWARDYQAKWEAMSEDKRDTSDYLIDIDAFTQTKFQDLLKHLPADVASIQVVPVIHYPGGEGAKGHNEAQFEGPTADTDCWGVYTRDHRGLASWVSDCADENTAMVLGRALAAEHGVEIEPQPWKEKQHAS